MLNGSLCSVGTIHSVWSSVDPCVQDVKRAAVKVKILTSTYLLQATRAKFRQHNVTPTCPLCGLEDEDKVHFLLVCDQLAPQRQSHLPQLLAEASLVLPEVDVSRNRDVVLQLIVDCSALIDFSSFKETVYAVESISRRLVYALHCRRMELLTAKCLSKKKPPKRQ